MDEPDYVSPLYANILACCIESDMQLPGMDLFFSCDPRIEEERLTRGDRHLLRSSEPAVESFSGMRSESEPAFELMDNASTCSDHIQVRCRRKVSTPCSGVVHCTKSCLKSRSSNLGKAVSFEGQFLDSIALRAWYSWNRALISCLGSYRQTVALWLHRLEHEHTVTAQTACPGVFRNRHPDPAPCLSLSNKGLSSYPDQTHCRGPVNCPLSQDTTMGTHSVGTGGSSSSSSYEHVTTIAGMGNVNDNLVLLTPFALARSDKFMGKHAAQERFTLFDVVDHMRILDAHPEWTVQDYAVEAARRTRDQPVAAIYMLKYPFEGLPPIQFVIRSVNVPVGWVNVPVDLRALQLGFHTLSLPVDASSYEAALRLSMSCVTIPPLFAPAVARGNLRIDPADRTQLDPFQTHALQPSFAMIARGIGNRNNFLLEQPEQSTSSSSVESTTPFFSSVDYEPPEGDMVVAYHSPGHRPWMQSHPNTITPNDMAQAASAHLGQIAGVSRWRTSLLPLQPHIAAVDLHCLALPIDEEGHSMITVLADFRPVFGPGLLSFVAIPVEVHSASMQENIVNATVDQLFQLALAEPPVEFFVTKAGNGGLVVPAHEGQHAVMDSFDVAGHFPGLLTMTRFFGASDWALAASRTMRTTSSTTTTPFEVEDPLRERLRLVPRNPLRVWLGIQGTGLFQQDFEGDPSMAEILASMWTRVLQQHAVSDSLIVRVAHVHPPATVAARELLISMELSSNRDTAGVWVDLRPSGVLSFQQVPIFADASCITDLPRQYKHVFLNGRKWEDACSVYGGAYIAFSITSHAPDVRSVDFFYGRIRGLEALAIPFFVPADLPQQTEADAEHLRSDALTVWENTLDHRLRNMGFVGDVRGVVIAGECFTVLAPSGRPTSMPDVAAWVSQWIVPAFGPVQLYQTQGQVGSRQVYIASGSSLDPHEMYFRVEVTDQSVIVFKLPHSVLPDTLRRLAPVDDAWSRPVPGRAWYAPFFPPADLCSMVTVGEGQPAAASAPTEGSEPVARQEVVPVCTRRWGNFRVRRVRFLIEHTVAVHERSAALQWLEAHTVEAPATSEVQPTTTSTTNMLVAPGVPVLHLVMERHCATVSLQQTDQAYLTAKLTELILHHLAHNRAYRQGNIRMAMAHPGVLNGQREIVLIWHPLEFHLYVVVDARSVGVQLRCVETDSDRGPSDLVEEDLLSRGAHVFVNGVPAALMSGPLQDGDYVSVEWSVPNIPALPRSAVFRSWPNLGLLAVDIILPDLSPVLRNQLPALGTVAQAIEDALDARATMLGYRLAVAKQAIVYSRVRGEIMICVEGRLPATHNQVCTALRLVPEWNVATDVLDTRSMANDASMFMARDPFEARQTWHLIPVPFLLQTYLLWQGEADTFARFRELPAPSHLSVGSATPEHGQVHAFRRLSLQDGTSMVQISSTRKSRVQPCQEIERTASPARAALCWQEVKDIVQQPEGDLGPQDVLRAGPFAGCKAHHWHSRTAFDVALLPEDLALITDRFFLATASVTPETALGEDHLRYTVFDASLQTRIRNYRGHQRVEWLLADLIRSTHRPIRSIQRLDEPVFGYPTPQFVLTFLDAPAHHLAVPIDCRSIGKGICTINVAPESRWFAIGESLSRIDPSYDRCEGVGEAFVDAMDRGRLILRSARQTLRNPLDQHLADLQHMFMLVRPPTPPVPSTPPSKEEQEPAANASSIGEQENQTSFVEANENRQEEVQARSELPAPAATFASIPTPGGRRKVPLVRCQKSSPLSLAEACPPPFEGVAGIRACLQALSIPWRNFWGKPEDIVPAVLLKNVTKVQAHGPPITAFHVFTDGSSKAGKGGWGAVLCAQHDHQGEMPFSLVGVAGGSTGLLFAHSCDADHTNNAAEAQGLLMATLFALSTGPVPLHLHGDSKIAIGEAAGWSAPVEPAEGPASQVHKALRYVTQVLQEMGKPLAHHWVKGHAGCVWNEIADRVADAGRTGKIRTALAPCVYAIVRHKLLPWAWMTHNHATLPSLDDMARGQYEKPDKPSPDDLAVILKDVECTDKVSSQPCQLKFLSANVCTLVGKIAAFKQQGSELGIHVMAFQETRCKGGHVPGKWITFQAGANKGFDGVALWFNSGIAWGPKTGSVPLCPEHLFVLVQEPTLLAVACQHPSCKAMFVSFRGPHSLCSPHQIKQWWLTSELLLTPSLISGLVFCWEMPTPKSSIPGLRLLGIWGWASRILLETY